MWRNHDQFIAAYDFFPVVSSGGSADYVKGVYGTRFVYTYKLRDDSDYAWTLPDDAIDYNNEETRDSIAALISETHKLAYEDTV